MATTPAEQGIYPFSTRDAEAIPLDIVDPISIVKKALIASGASSFTIPADYALGHIYSDVDCFLQFALNTIPTPVADNTPYANTLFIPASTIITVKLTPGTAKVIVPGSVAGFIVVQAIRKWNSLALQQQVRIN